MIDPDATEAFLSYLAVERGLSQNTIDNYGRDLRQLEGLLPNGLEKASREELRRVFVDLGAGGMNPSSIARKISTLRHFYQYSRRKRVVVGNPLRGIPVPKRGFRLPKPVSTGDFDKLLAAAGNQTPSGLCEYAILRLFDSCGLRVSELIKLTPEDLHLDEGHLIVRGGKGDKDRFVPIDEAGAKALTDYMLVRPKVLAHRRGSSAARHFALGETRIFPLTRQRIWQILEAVCVRAGIPIKHPHQLRHRFGSEMTKSGLELREVADLMGHSSVDTTQQYVGLDLDYMRDIFRKTHPRAVRHD